LDKFLLFCTGCNEDVLYNLDLLTLIRRLSDNPFTRRVSIGSIPARTRTYTYELSKEGLKDFVEQKKGESDEAYKSRLKDIWIALKDYEETVDEEELDESIVDEAIQQAVDHVEDRDKEVLTFVFDDHPTLKLTIAQWREFEDYKGPGALKSSTTDDEGNQYNIYVKPS